MVPSNRRIPVYERLNDYNKYKSRQGYFRNLKGQLSEMEMNKKKDTQLAANLQKYESHKMLKQQLMND